jgi:hypothetical protein
MVVSEGTFWITFFCCISSLAFVRLHAYTRVGLGMSSVSKETLRLHLHCI